MRAIPLKISLSVCAKSRRQTDQHLKKQENNRELYAGPSLDQEDGVFPENVEALLRKRRPYRQMIGTTSREFRTSESYSG